MRDHAEPPSPAAPSEILRDTARDLLARRLIDLGRAPECSCHPIGGHPAPTGRGTRAH